LFPIPWDITREKNPNLVASGTTFIVTNRIVPTDASRFPSKPYLAQHPPAPGPPLSPSRTVGDHDKPTHVSFPYTL